MRESPEEKLPLTVSLTAQEVMDEAFKRDCNALRARLLVEGTDIRALMQHPEFSRHPSEKDHRDFGEMKANIMLAFRHVEDARMRLGKAIQAKEGGISILDK